MTTNRKSEFISPDIKPHMLVNIVRSKPVRFYVSGALLALLVGMVAFGPLLTARLQIPGASAPRFAAEPGESEENEGQLLLAMGDYWFTRLTYPTGVYNGAWVQQAAEQDAAVPRGVPAGRVTYQPGRSQSPLTLDPNQFTSLGPQPLLSGADQYAGRTNVIASDPVSPTVAYIGSDGGGVWKTTNCCSASTVWTPMTDDPLLASIAIGDLQIDPNDHNTIYAGTGDLRYGSWSFGSSGLLKSTDAGLTWEILGADVFNPWYNPPSPPPNNYPQYQAIGKVRVDPRNSNTVIVGTKTGVFFSYDAGATWEGPCLTNSYTTQRQDTTGLEVVDTGSSTLLYAAIGTRGFETSVQSDLGQNGANGVYRTTLPASGCPASWTAITHNGNGWTGTNATSGTPYGGAGVGNQLGRLDMDISESNPDVIYVQVADIPTRGLYAVYRSIDGGDTWAQRATTANLLGCSAGGGQSWYDHGITVDPNNPDVVFISNIDVARSVDGGATFYNLTCSYNGGNVHPDAHGRAFVGGTSNVLLISNDGGVYLTENADAALPDDVSFIDLNDSLNTIEFYSGDITANFAYSTTPGINAGAQDNGSSVYVWAGDPGPAQWEVQLGGDGMYARIEPVHAQRWYQEWQNGNLTVSTTGPYGAKSGAEGNWDASGDRVSFVLPYEIDRYNNCGGPNGCTHLIAGTERVWETINGADPSVPIANRWYINSPDLTKGTLADRSFINQLSYAVSDGSVAIAGTNDGNVQYGFFMGSGLANSAYWADVTGGNTVLPNRPILDVTTDPQNPRLGYAAVGGFDQNTPATPGHVYQVSCTNLCVSYTWVNKSGNLPNIPINTILVNPNYRQQVFAGSDWGLYYTNNIDAATPTWMRFTAGLPTVMIWDMAIDRGFTTLALFTRARGAYAWPLPSAPFGPYYEVALAPDSSLEGLPGGSVTHDFVLQNLGDSDTYTLTVSGAAWNTALLTASPVSLATGEAITVSVQVDLPLTPGASDAFTLQAVSFAYPDTVMAQAGGSTQAVVHPGVATSGDMDALVTSDAPVVYPVMVTNSGDYTDTFDISLGASSWPAASQFISLTLGAGQSAVNEVSVTPGSGLADSVTVSFTSQLDNAVNAALTLTSHKSLAVALPLNSTQEGLPGAQVTHVFNLKNLGPTDSYTLEVGGGAWTTSLQTSPLITVTSGATQTIEVLVELGAVPFTQDSFVLTATSVTSPSLSVTASGASLAVVHPAVTASADTTAQSALQGEVIVYTLTVTNTGDFADTFNVTLGGNTWTTSASAGSIDLAAGASGTVEISVTVGAEASDSVTVTFTSGLDDGVSSQVTLTSTREEPQPSGTTVFLPLVTK